MSAKAVMIPRQPSHRVREAVAAAVRTVLAEGHDYREAMRIFRHELLKAALEQSGQLQKKAVKRLGISRDHMRRYLGRGV